MEGIKQDLVEAGVIGRVVGDFNPHIKINVIYGDKRISLGEEVSPAEVRHKPDSIEYRYDPDRPELLETFKNPTLITLIMTDPDAPGGEYLHWYGRIFLNSDQISGKEYLNLFKKFVITVYLIPTLYRLMTDFITAESDRESSWEHLIAYEAPKPMGTRKIVFTLFKPNEAPIAVPRSRENFSTRNFADTNALGPPIAAAFFTIKDENEGGENSEVDSPTCSTGRTFSERGEVEVEVEVESSSKRRCSRNMERH